MSLNTGCTSWLEAKTQLAGAVVERYHGCDAAKAETNWFEATFSQRATPEDAPVVDVPSGAGAVELVARCLPVATRSHVRRLLQQGAVRLNDERLGLAEAAVPLASGDVLKIGKRQWFRLRLVTTDCPFKGA